MDASLVLAKAARIMGDVIFSLHWGDEAGLRPLGCGKRPLPNR